MTIITRRDRYLSTVYRIYPAIGQVHAETHGRLEAVWSRPVIDEPGPDFSELTEETVIGFYFEPGKIVIRARFTQGVRKYTLRCVYSERHPEVRARAIRDGFA